MVNSTERSFWPTEGDRFFNSSAAPIAEVSSSHYAASRYDSPHQGSSHYGMINQAILRYVPVWPSASHSFTPTVVSALQHLVEAVASLAPELQDAVRLDEIQERAADVLLALAQPTDEDSDDSPDHFKAQVSSPTFVSLKDLTPWLLWGIARSAYGAMRLLEGTLARVLQPDQSWQSGMLRLVTALEVKTPHLTCIFDAVTQQATPDLLGSDRLLQFGDVSLCQDPTSIRATLKLLTEQLIQTTPALAPFLQGFQTEILVPHEQWQPTWLQLHLGFEFMPLAASSLPSTARTDAPVVQFTHPDWKERFVRVATRQHLVSRLPQFTSLRASDPDISALVADAQQILDRQRTCLTLTSRNFIQQDLQLDELALRLLWGFSHSAYEVMQLMSGISIQLLQPGDIWRTGTLRLSISLDLQTPELDWCLDLITGQSPEVSPTGVALNSVARSTEIEWLQEPTLLESLQAQVRHHLNQATPELLLLMEGAEVDLLGQDGQWQPGGMRLSASFEFIADIASP